MAASYRAIDYRIRPAKFAERLMLCDTFRRLKFASVESYQYIGLGSVYFSDFALFHKALGIDSMTSIEREVGDKQRFLDNLPFSSISMLWGDTKTELSSVNLSLRSIVWLDYDGRLTRNVLDDIRSVTSRVCSGSVFIVSLQCVPERATRGDEKGPLAVLSEELGGNHIDSDIKDDDFLGWGTARIFRKIIVNQIAETLAARNGALPQGQRMSFEPILNFHYKDGAHMVTIGGVFFDRGQRQVFDQCAFQELSFVKTGDDAFRIDIPKLTGRELRNLERQMPLNGVGIDMGSMPSSDAQAFMKIYRYFPNFLAVEL